jgi:hypothetical protein
MTRTLTNICSKYARLLLLASFAVVAVGCSSSSDSDDETDNTDTVSNPDSIDVNNDGVLDSLDDFDGNGIVDNADVVAFEASNPDEPVDVPQCNNNGSDSTWASNCSLQDGIAWANSTYSLGAQRILWCLGYDEGADFNTFADGIYGRNTQNAAELFQADEGLTADGIIGEASWPRLLASLAGPNAFDQTLNWYSVQSTRPECDNVIMFYQDINTLQWFIEASPGDNVPNIADFGTEPLP